MSTRLRTSPLIAPEADRAYPIARLAAGVTLAQWRAFVSRRTGDDSFRSGILVVQDARDYILGLGSYYVAEELGHGSVMVVDKLFALDMMGGEFVSRLLLRHLVRLAREQGFCAVETHLPATDVEIHGRAESLLRLMREDGHQVGEICTMLDLSKSKENVSFLPAPAIRRAAKGG